MTLADITGITATAIADLLKSERAMVMKAMYEPMSRFATLAPLSRPTTFFTSAVCCAGFSSGGSVDMIETRKPSLPRSTTPESVKPAPPAAPTRAIASTRTA